MKILSTRMLFCFWILLPVIALAFHYYYGIRIDQRQKVEQLLDQAAKHAPSGAIDSALACLDAADKIVSQHPELKCLALNLRRGVLLAQGRYLVQAGDILAQTLENQDLTDDYERFVLIESLGYALFEDALYMRLQGYERPYWEPVADHARRMYKYLAVHAPQGDAFLDNLETVTLLTRLDLATLKDQQNPQQDPKQKQKDKKEKGKQPKPNGNKDREGAQKGKKRPGGGNGNDPQKRAPKDVRAKEELKQRGGYGAPDLLGS